MNWGKFAVEALREWNPRGPEAITRRARNKAFRKAYRKHRKGKFLTPEEQALMSESTSTIILPSGEKVVRTEPTINARTSTKMGVAGIAGVVPIIQGIQEIEFPWPWLENFTNSDLFVQVATIAALWLVARMSKSPSKPGAL